MIRILVCGRILFSEKVFRHKMKYWRSSNSRTNGLNFLYYHLKHIFYIYLKWKMYWINNSVQILLTNSHEIVLNLCNLFHENEYSWNSESKQKFLIKFQQSVHLSKRNKFTIFTLIREISSRTILMKTFPETMRKMKLLLWILFNHN
jgi:hypothetical protein